MICLSLSLSIQFWLPCFVHVILFSKFQFSFVKMLLQLFLSRRFPFIILLNFTTVIACQFMFKNNHATLLIYCLLSCIVIVWILFSALPYFKLLLYLSFYVFPLLFHQICRYNLTWFFFFCNSHSSREPLENLFTPKWIVIVRKIGSLKTMLLHRAHCSIIKCPQVVEILGYRQIDREYNFTNAATFQPFLFLHR